MNHLKTKANLKYPYLLTSILILDILFYLISAHISTFIVKHIGHYFLEIPKITSHTNYILFVFFLFYFVLILFFFGLYKFPTNDSLERNKLQKVFFYYSSLFFFSLIKEDSLKISVPFLFIHLSSLFVYLSFMRIYLKKTLISKFLKPEFIYLGRVDLFERIKKSHVLFTFIPFFTNSPINWNPFFEKFKKIYSENKELIFLVDAKAVSPTDLAKILAVFRPYVFSIYLLYETEDPFQINKLSAESLIKGYNIIEISGGLLYILNLKIKRLIDVILSILLMPFFAIIFLICAILIRIESRGPIIFSQERVGKDGRLFRIYKFRTMYINSDDILKEELLRDPELRNEWENFRKLKRDPRITRVGRILRRLSLDELPQIVNVLKGEMSLVGPRPITLEELDKYYQKFASLYKLVPPGLTGLWQVSGRNEIAYDTRVKLDVYYILNWSLLLDLYILLKTIPAVISGRGSY
ncbi:MAG: exopolysaccharide biosynthesis polyprenyl glycosylphosphotransferase [Archaeoglobaceae archaeon]